MNQIQINRQGRNYIAGLANTVHVLWGKMMDDLGLPTDSKFVEADFLATSNYHPFYDNALRQYWEARQQYADGGYVGLSLRK